MIAAEDVPPEDPAGTQIATLIPAYEEAANVAPVVRAALAAHLGPVLVIDDGSRDRTSQVARAAGARVLTLETNVGKGGALAAGARAVRCDVVVLLDADLVGLQPAHVHELVAPVLSGEADMTRGSFQGGRWQTTAAQQVMPQLTGQRALKRDALLSVPGLEESRYGVEVAITRAAKDLGWHSVDVHLEGVTQVMKEEKHGWRGGLKRRLRMYGEVLKTLLFRRGSAPRREE